MSKNLIKVLVIDDSALVRKMLSEILNSDAQIEVVGTAADPIMARQKIKQLNPDVLTLDVEMPKMDGVTFLSNLMRLRPMPVVMVSTLTEAGAEITLDALELGAVDFINKPKTDFSNTIQNYAAELIEKVKVASVAQLASGTPKRKKNIEKILETKVEKKHSADEILKLDISRRNYKLTDSIIAIGSSTGGTEAIREVLKDMPADSPGIVITQHIPEKFSASFAKRMDNVSAMKVCEATDGQQILAGHVYIAPGGQHLLVERSGARYVCRLNDGPAVNRHKPSVNVLFRSVANQLGQNAIGVILTGMGDDGAEGLLEMKQTGAITIAQDERSSVVWGMPGEAVKLNAADEILPLNKVAKRLINLYSAKAA
ncbi:MAG: protein-glutamate methylesterase/protein-glutamine glutaminase [Gammaproteobacteria bacterium]|jgi:two-component system chemotaxis response regulator CheB